MSLEKLKLLTAKTPSMERSSRGRDALTWEDVSAALSKAKPLASLYARVCFAGDRAKIKRLEKKIFDEVIAQPGMQNAVVRIGTLRDLVRLSVIEASQGQQFPVKDKRAPAAKIRILKLKNPSMWYRKYSGIYAVIQVIFMDLERDAARAVKRGISD